MSVALLTGASSGIGLEFAKLLARDNHDIILVARSKSKLEALAQSLEKSNSIKCFVIECDLGRNNSALELYNKVAALNLHPDILINNAGFGDVTEFASENIAKIEEMMTLNMTTLTLLTRYFVADMVKRKSGRIMNVASTAAYQPGPFMAVYYATKAYVLSFTHAIAVELHATGVTATALCPGPVITGFQAAANMGDARLLKMPMILGADQVAQIGYRAMNRGTAEAIAGTMNWISVFSTRLAPRHFVAKMAARLNQGKPT